MVRSFAESVGMVGCAFILVLAAVFASGAVYVVYLNTLGVAQINAERNVTVHSQQYIQTQQQVLVNYYSDWVAAPDAAHKEASRLQLCAQAAMLIPTEYPVEVAPFIAQNCH